MGIEEERAAQRRRINRRDPALRDEMPAREGHRFDGFDKPIRVVPFDPAIDMEPETIRRLEESKTISPGPAFRRVLRMRAIKSDMHKLEESLKPSPWAEPAKKKEPVIGEGKDKSKVKFEVPKYESDDSYK